MITKIQKYLLLNQPILWNIRIVPMIIILIGVHLVFFGIGYISTNAAFDNSYYYYSPDRDLGILYFVSILVGVLLMIGWLVYYLRNNGFKTFYPRKTYQLYVEWLLIFVITTGITLIPYTLTRGYIAKWQSVASVEETKKALSIMNKVKILIPDDTHSFSYMIEYDKPIPVPESLSMHEEDINFDLYATEYDSKNGFIIKGYIGNSLLFYKESEYDYKNYLHKHPQQPINEKTTNRIKQQELVKQWLREQKKDSIYAIMKDFDELRLKHNLKTELTLDKWFAYIYNPPFFPVTASNRISKHYCEEETTAYEDYNVAYATEAIELDSMTYETEAEQTYYISDRCIPFYNLEKGYNHVLKCHKDNYNTEIIVLFCLCFSLVASFLVFSFRTTTGKSWLIALITAGVLIFITSLIGVGLAQAVDYDQEEIIVMFMCSVWTMISMALLTKILYKIKEKDHKGKSHIYTNIFLWLAPCIIPLVYLTRIAFLEYTDISHSTKDEQVMCMFWINIIVVVIAMWPITAIIRKWKSLPEE